MSASFRPQVAGEYPEPPQPRVSFLALYECTDELHAVRAMLLESETGEISPEGEALLDHATGQFDEKVERVARVVLDLLADEKKANDEADRLARRARAFRNAATRLKSYLQQQMERADVRKVERTTLVVRLQASPPSVRHVLTSEQLAGAEYAPFVRVVPTTYQLDSKSVVTSWKAGEALPEGVAVEQASHLRII